MTNKDRTGTVPQPATADGRVIYAIEQRRASARIHTSTDAGLTWQAGAIVELDGPHPDRRQQLQHLAVRGRRVLEIRSAT
ncbi:hypothetical protein OHA21_37590 [Actinoplanes sp. NBC_00393]|uniref:hypothetical protein n=1 Tax=Actinoplanes sp. NBC_00393 TaxID=2975953 RepID=UPI002E1DF896